ncbi:MAG: 6,7-dimethyl-8-ribityllumazine synthase [Hyphomicrobiaceae bacterium]|nr:MAG: 6,7-dimethyl-8-ribityllumazine synthase [Hyphomicrobiaceae bacterium]
MAGKAEKSVDAVQGAAGARILVIEARFYKTIADELAAGTMAELDAAAATVERIAVPGCLEIPLALAQVVKAGRFAAGARAGFDGCVALGCVIRGETTHYDTVCANANHWLMEIAVRHGIALGNAILTVENEGQALARARGGRNSKGAEAARACLALVGNARRLAEART